MDQEKLKSYWQRPGGKFGTLMGLGILGLIGWKLLPILTTIVWNTINFGIAVGVGAVLLYVFVLDGRLRKRLFYFYEILMKGMAGIIMKIDPFVIAEDMINDMSKDRLKLRDQMVEVSQQKEGLDAKILERQEDIRKQQNIMMVAKGRSDMGLALSNAARQVGRLEEFIRQLTPIRDALNKVSEHLTKVYKSSAYLIEDAQNELTIKKDLYQSVTKGSNALNRALRLFEGDPDKKLLAAQSMEYLKDDIAGKMANMKLAMSVTDEFVQKIDLENATYEQDGLARLAALSDDANFRLNKNGAQEQASTKTTQHSTLLD